MKFKFEKTHLIIIAVVVVLFVLFYPMPDSSSSGKINSSQEGKCQTDQDCFVFGETGTCACGCYSQEEINKLEENRTETCFCLAPKACQCYNGDCVRKV